MKIKEHIQRWINKHATPYPYVYWEVPGELIFDFLEAQQNEGILYQGNDINFSRQLIGLMKLKEKNITTFWALHEYIIDGKHIKTLCNHGGHEPVYCGRKIIFKNILGK